MNKRINFEKALNILKDNGRINTTQWGKLSARIVERNGNAEHLDIRIFRKLKNDLEKMSDTGLSKTYKIKSQLSNKKLGEE